VPLFFATPGFVLTHALQSAPPRPVPLRPLPSSLSRYWLGHAVAFAIVRYAVCAPGQTARFSSTLFGSAPAGTGKGYYILGGVEWSHL